MQKVRRERWPKTAAMSSSSALATFTANVFEAGKCTTVVRKVESRTTCSAANTSPLLPVTPPKPLFKKFLVFLFSILKIDFSLC